MTSGVKTNPKIGETRRSEWTSYGHFGAVAYRIWMVWTEHGMRQRHEWKNTDGSIDLDDWISTPVRDFSSYLLPIDTALPLPSADRRSA